MGRNYRKYPDGSICHVYCKAVNGNIIFYSSRDIIFYLTLYYHLARKYGIVTRAIAIMPNHVHSNEQAPSKESFISFHRDLNREFAKEYNLEHKRTGRLFMKPFGYAPKFKGKTIRENITYIVNNPVVGGLCKDIDSYKWTLMAYRNSDHPFSEKIVLNKASFRLRRSLTRLKYYFDNGIPLNYSCQRMLFDGLSTKESAQLTDRILSMHNCLEYNRIAQYYQGDMEKAIMAISANSGTEYDINEDSEDYSKYRTMTKICLQEGLDMKQINFETMDVEQLAKLADKFLWAGVPPRLVCKFLHMEQAEK